VAFPSVDDRSGLNETSSTTPNDCGISLSCASHPGDVDDIRNDDTDPTKIPSDGSEGDLSGILRPIASCQPSEESETISSGCSGSQPVTEITACSSSKSPDQSVTVERSPHAPFRGTLNLPQAGALEQGQGLERRHQIYHLVAVGPRLIQILKTNFYGS
jgi:hypothetical protein